MPKEIFTVRNRTTLQAAILDYVGAGVQSPSLFFSINIIIQQQVN